MIQGGFKAYIGLYGAIWGFRGSRIYSLGLQRFHGFGVLRV